ncbi:aminotransferase class I/II-fold pyridoxal phosphate-dependent enzyme [Lysinibacter sp. HNR]|uniref:aminotransferase class I/II-fold pyridoxal phosphate-dependent enzyme n=1 Tax=Lysinibacter sp. HNR TaxID=3031408 RepID=UPI002435DE6D|nr:aminotransferase class I/II-fold pyridoxal phosphate-dependent enzyme [Lysinibacter sp. HNR]WGD37304.1 aminotransferase class I/II-fold pyridoxal phosphate-dependent enzyme [Lysinibacter sp. HNR]
MNNTPVRLRAEILAKPPYVQGAEPAPGGFKLSSNENPYEPLPSVVSSVLSGNHFNRYPDASVSILRETLAARFGVGLDEVHVTAGSVSLLYQLVAAAAGAGDEYIYSWRSFEAYPGLGVITGATPIAVPNRPDSSHDLDAIAAAITDRTRLIVLCSPNNPTGNAISTADFEAFMERVPPHLLVVLDEAYREFVTDLQAVDGTKYWGSSSASSPAAPVDFPAAPDSTLKVPAGSPTAPSREARYPNLVILRTFSKAYGLAGLRIGYGIGDARILAAARTAGIPMSVTDSAQQAALASLEPRAEEELLSRVSTIVRRRDHLVAALRAAGWNIPDTQGNFLWIPLGQHTVEAARLFAEAGLIVRPFGGEGIRISIGEEESLAPILSTAARIYSTLPQGHSARTVHATKGNTQ